MSLLEKGMDTAIKDFDKIKYDTVQYDISEKTFVNLGSEFIGSRSFKRSYRCN